MVLTISRIHSHFPAIARLRPALVLFLLALAVAVSAPRLVSLKNLFRTWPPQVVAGLGILACIAAPFGISFGLHWATAKPAENPTAPPASPGQKAVPVPPPSIGPTTPGRGAGPKFEF